MGLGKNPCRRDPTDYPKLLPEFNIANYSMLHILHTISIINHIIMIKKNVLVAFGKKIRQIRKGKGMSQEELSFKANLHRTYIGMIERAEKNITLANIEKIAKALDVDIKNLF